MPAVAPHKVTLIPGDGIGPEITKSVLTVLDATGVSIDWEPMPAGEASRAAGGDLLPADTVSSIRRNRVALKGPLTTPVGAGFRSVNVALRIALDLYANIRPVVSLPGVPSRYSGVDLAIVRENTEDLYTGAEHMVSLDAAESIKIITRQGSTRIARFAFDYAVRHGRRKVTAIHKANIMKLTDGLYLECCRAVAAEYPQVEYDEKIIDNICMQLVRNPESHDVLLGTNLYGDIVSDLCAGLVGGLGVAPGANFGKDVAVFEAAHGSAPKYAGTGRANPTALLLSAVMMLVHLGEQRAADRVRTALYEVLREGKYVTADIGGNASCFDMASAIADKVVALAQ